MKDTAKFGKSDSLVCLSPMMMNSVLSGLSFNFTTPDQKQMKLRSSIRTTTNLYSTTFLSNLIGREGSRDIMVTMAMEVTSFLRDLIG